MLNRPKLPFPSADTPAPDDAGKIVPIAPAVPKAGPAALEPGSVTARALYRIWAGEPVTVVDSPPGAGKTATIVTVVSYLANAAGLRVLIGTPNNSQVVALAHRLVKEIDPKLIEVKGSGVQVGSLPAGLYNGSRAKSVKPAQVTLRTLMGCSFSDTNGYDVMVVDEAYQATYTDVALAAKSVNQILLVGDPGQIGPVITVDTAIWEANRTSAPHRRAPEVFAARPDAHTLVIDRSYRLGPKSVHAVAPLYDFTFESARPERTLTGPDGTAVDEIESVQTDPAEHADDMAVLSAVADRVEYLAGGALDGPEGPRPVAPADVAVVLSRNSQVSIVTGLLAERGLTRIAGTFGEADARGTDRPGVTVGTADKLQGGEWPVVVALDPAAGATGSDHSMSLGRLGVMISRQNTHLTWVHDGTWKEACAGDKKALAVRSRLTGV